MKTIAPLLLASLLPLSLTVVACSGADSTADLYGNPSPQPSASTTTQADAGPTPDANAIPPLVKHCNGTVAAADLCLENAQGHAGELVDVDVFFLGNGTTCTEALEISGHIVADASHFELANKVEQVDCITRDLSTAPAPGTTEIMWNHFGAGAISACPNKVPVGKTDTIKVKILPGTPPGIYPIKWTDAGIASPVSECAVFAPTAGIGGSIRVLP
jgi:hypothetical protein